MAKLKCICGSQISNVSSPNTVEGYLISDLDMENCNLDGAMAVMDAARGMWECWNCGRLGFNHPDKHSSSVKWYRPEDGQNGALLKTFP
jgi:hypothetical protein